MTIVDLPHIYLLPVAAPVYDHSHKNQANSLLGARVNSSPDALSTGLA